MTFLWLLVGLVVLFSASYALADSRFDNGLYYFIRQLIWLWIGLIGFNFLVRLPIENLLKIAPWMILLVLGLILIGIHPKFLNYPLKILSKRKRLLKNLFI